MKSIQQLAIISTLFSGTTVARADMGGRDIRFEDCPKSVQMTITENARGGTIEDVEFLTVEGRKIYIADVNLPRNQDLEVHVFGDGTLLKTREDIPLRKTPAPVRKAIRNFKGKVDDVDKEISNGKVSYQIEIDRIGRPDLHLRISKAGRILEKSKGDPYDIDFTVGVPLESDGNPSA